MPSKRQNTGKKYLALIEWVGGPDAGRLTPGIPIEWIKKFSYSAFLQADPHEHLEMVYVVEWHDSTKAPLGGWPVYDGKIIEVSDDIRVLNRAFKMSGGVKSPNLDIKNSASDALPSLPPIPQQNEGSFVERKDSLNVKDSEEEESPQYSPIRKKQKLAFDTDTEESDLENKKLGESDNEVGKNCDPGSKIKKPAQKPISNKIDENSTLQTASTNKDKKEKIVFQKRCAGGENKLVTLDALKKTLRDVKKDLENYGRSQETHDSRSSDDDIKSDDDSNGSGDDKRNDEKKENVEKVEIGKKGSGVFVPKYQWTTIKRSATFTAMGIALVQNLFPLEVLLRSNLAGGRCKIKKPDGQQSTEHVALDRKIKTAIYDEVQKRYPQASNRAILGTSINNKLNHLRKRRATEETSR